MIDLFCGGGGASTGIEIALGRTPDVAVDHSPDAVAMHAANHPASTHLCQSVWRADPRDMAAGRPVGLLWASPDCRHFSKAKGGQPVRQHIRDLAWVVVHYAKLVRPRVILLENVEEFRDWGPLVQTDDGQLMPCPERKGLTFRRWKRELVKLGYRVEDRELRACDYGAPTSRKRLFVVARCDGLPIVWPAPTHAKGGAGGLPAWRSAAEYIDWSLPCPSIFGRRKPLAEATLRRIAKGLQRYVIDAPNPFIVPVTHRGDARVHSIDEPLRTITTASRGEFMLATPFIAPRYGERPTQDPRTHSVEEPLPTIVPTGNGARLVAAFLAQHNGGMVGHDAREPVSTISSRGSQQQLVTSNLIKLRNNGVGADMRDPLHTITSGGEHHAEVRAFLITYYGTDQDPDIRVPLATITTKHRHGLVTVHGVDYQIVDIGMRMLTPRELYRAQGFPDSYRIDSDADGRPITKTAQVKMVGNSVCPPVAAALVAANVAGLSVGEAA